MKQQLVSDEMYNVELLSVLCAIAGVYVVHNDYKHMISLVKKMNEILSVTMLQVYKPGISVFEAKCYLYFENDKNKAKELYHSATILAEQFDDKVFDKKSSHLMDDWIWFSKSIKSSHNKTHTIKVFQHLILCVFWFLRLFPVSFSIEDVSILVTNFLVLANNDNHNSSQN